jgi:uncharacterized protein (DUF1501 family)
MRSSDRHCCSEYLQLSRRQFLASTGGAAVALSVPAWLPRVAMADSYCSSRDIIVSVFLRGAADGLTMCVPHAEDAYYAARPLLSIPRPDSSSPFRAIDLDGFFGFPQPLSPLLTAYNAGHLLVVHACGSTNPSRSHFDAMRYMEVGKPADETLFTGWLGRHLASIPPLTPGSILRGLGIGHGLQQSLHSGPKTLPIPQPEAFGLSAPPVSEAGLRSAIADMYQAAGGELWAATETTLATIDLLDTINFSGYQPAGGAVYPIDAFGMALKSTAALIKAEVGVEAVAIDIEGWDTHNAQGTAEGGVLPSLMTTLAGGLAAFHLDIFAGNGRNVTVVVMSEFGRRVAENGSEGTDHGHGNAMLVLGSNIAGGRVLTQWPGLAPGQLFEGLDLEVTTDFRDILAEIVFRRLANPNLDIVFPQYTPTFRGVTQPCDRGDLNCDGATNVSDIPDFSQALTDPDGYSAAHPGCDPSFADVNADGQVDGRDVQAFTQTLLQP